MTDIDHQEDDQWLAALAGNPDPKADPRVNRQAADLRKALQENNKALDSNIPKADEALYQQILFRLRRERILEPTESDSQLETNLLSRLPGGVDASPSEIKPRRSFRPAYWGLAASLSLGTVLVLQSGFIDRGDSDFAVRGERNATILIVQDPQSKSTELLEGLKGVGAEPSVELLSSGRIKIVVKSSNTVLDYLMLERITPTIKDGKITLILDPTPK